MHINEPGILAERAQLLRLLHHPASYIPELPSTLRFRCGSQIFHIGISLLQGCSNCRVVPVPLSPPWLRGIANHEGSYWPVADLTGQFSEPKPDTEQIVVFLRHRPLGLAISEILGLVAAQAPQGPQPSQRPLGTVPGFIVLETLMDGTRQIAPVELHRL